MEIKAKTLSLISKVLAVVFAIVGFLVFKLEATQVLIIAGFIANAFISVDASILTKNIKGRDNDLSN